MKIIKIWSSFQTELKYHDHYLSEIMQKYGVTTTFISSDKIDREYLPFLNNKNIHAGEDDYKGSKIIRLKAIEFMRKPFITDITYLHKLLCDKKYDLIHMYGIGNPVSLLVLLILKFCKKKIPVVINDHSNPNLKNNSLLGNIYYRINIFLFSKLSDPVELVITPNLASSDFIRQQYNIQTKKMKIIPLGYDAQIFNYDENLKNKSNKLIIGFAGRIVPGKNLELLIDVISEINNVEIQCELIGTNYPPTEYQKSLATYIKTKKLNIKLKPLIKDPLELAKFYNYIDLAVFPGSISITTLEATGCGTPVIIFNSIKGLEDRVSDQRGFLFKTKNELKKYILYYNELKLNQAIPNESIAINSQPYSWQEISKQYLRIYKTVLS